MGKKKTSEKKSFAIPNPKYFIIAGGVIAFLVLAFCIYYFLLTPQIDLKGKKKLVLNYQDSYQEKGYEARYLGNDITKKVKEKYQEALNRTTEVMKDE